MHSSLPSMSDDDYLTENCYTILGFPPSPSVDITNVFSMSYSGRHNVLVLSLCFPCLFSFSIIAVVQIELCQLWLFSVNCYQANFFNPHPRMYLLVLGREEGIERERKRGREREREIVCATTGDWTHNLGMCPDWRLNPQPFGVWEDAPTNWSTWPGPK